MCNFTIYTNCFCSNSYERFYEQLTTKLILLIFYSNYLKNFSGLKNSFMNNLHKFAKLCFCLNPCKEFYKLFLLLDFLRIV